MAVATIVPAASKAQWQAVVPRVDCRPSSVNSPVLALIAKRLNASSGWSSLSLTAASMLPSGDRAGWVTLSGKLVICSQDDAPVGVS